MQKSPPLFGMYPSDAEFSALGQLNDHSGRALSALPGEASAHEAHHQAGERHPHPFAVELRTVVTGVAVAAAGRRGGSRVRAEAVPPPPCRGTARRGRASSRSRCRQACMGAGGNQAWFLFVKTAPLPPLHRTMVTGLAVAGRVSVQPTADRHYNPCHS